MKTTNAYLLFAVIYFYAISGFAQNNEYSNYFNNIKTNGFTTDTSVLGLQNNPAGTTLLNNINLGLQYINYYGLHEVLDYNVNTCIPIHNNNIGISYSTLGNEYIKESILSGFICRKISKIHSLGIGLNTHILSSEFNRNYTFLPEISFFSKPIENFKFGIHCINQISYNKKNSHSSIYKIGFEYNITNKIVLGCSYFHENTFGNFIKTGLKYYIWKNIQINCNYSNKKGDIELGASWINNKYILEYQTKYIPCLGYIQKACFIYIFKK